MQRLPDRTGIFILPLCLALAAVITSALLVYSLLRENVPSRHAQPVIDSMLVALSQALGGVGVAIVSAVLVVPSCVWFARAYRQYQVAVANDRRQMR